METQLSKAMQLGPNCPVTVLEQLRQAPLADVTKSLGPFLCKENAVESAMWTLAQATAGRDVLPDASLKMVCQFFAEKMQYKNLVSEALASLATVAGDRQSRGEQCGADTFTTLIASPFWTIQVQGLPLAMRRQFFQCLEYLLSSQQVGSIGEKELRTVLDAIDGESDPQLVLRSFKIHAALARKVAPDVFALVAQDFFESVSSYFPIVFAKPPGCTVTKNDLREALASAMEMEVYREHCVPFLFGKLASPSFSVKDDVLETLRACMIHYSEDGFREFAAELVLQMRNQVLKLSAFTDHDNNPALGNQIEVCCDVMRVVSRRYSDARADKSELLKVFEPISEGLIASATSQSPQTCASYATMMFHIVTGGWASCLHVGTYTLTMLTLNVHDAVTPHAAILISGVCSGILDAVSSFAGEHSTKAELRGALQQATPLLVECGKQAAAMLKRGITGVQEEKEPTDDIPITLPGSAVLSTLCLAECVASLIKLSAALGRLIADEDTLLLAHCLASAARCYERSVVGAQIARLFCGCLELTDNRACVCVLNDIVTSRDRENSAECDGWGASCMDTLQFLRRVGGASSGAAELILLKGLLSDECSWVTDNTVSENDIAEAALAILADSSEPQGDDAVSRFLSLHKLTSDAAYFACACNVYSKASLRFCEDRVAKLPGGLPLLETAALLSSRTDVVVPCSVADQVACELLEKCAAADGTSAAAALNGITGLVRCGANISADSYPSEVPAELVNVAVLWGKLLRQDAEPAEESLKLLIPSAERNGVNGSSSATGGSDEDVSLSALSFFPCLASLLPNRTHSVASWYIHAGGESAAAHPFFWKAVAVLLANEEPSVVEQSLSALIPLCERAINQVDETLLCRVMMQAAHHARHTTNLAEAALRNATLRRVLLSGTRTADLVTRCECLHFFGSLAGMIAASVDAGTAKEARRDILQAAQRALEDHKRPVRQAAAKCRQEWFKSRLP